MSQTNGPHPHLGWTATDFPIPFNTVLANNYLSPHLPTWARRVVCQNLVVSITINRHQCHLRDVTRLSIRFSTDFSVGRTVLNDKPQKRAVKGECVRTSAVKSWRTCRRTKLRSTLGRPFNHVETVIWFGLLPLVIVETIPPSLLDCRKIFWNTGSMSATLVQKLTLIHIPIELQEWDQNHYYSAQHFGLWLSSLFFFTQTLFIVTAKGSGPPWSANWFSVTSVVGTLKKSPRLPGPSWKKV